MSSFPRVALGTIQPGASCQNTAWALSNVLGRAGLSTQTFFSRAYFTAADASQPSTGPSPRHLDSWVMTRDVCRQTFTRAARNSDLAIVLGSFCEPLTDRGSRLTTIGQWLHLPRIALVDLAMLGQCQLPARPDAADCLLLDGLSNADQYMSARTNLETLWGIPVIGGLAKNEATRNALQEVRPGTPPPEPLVSRLGDSLAATLDVRALLGLAESRRFPEHAPSSAQFEVESDLTIAVAYDEVFNCYFPDTLDGLEQQGASLRVFSPMRDERLPEDTDVVYFGCGHPERFAEQLSANHCMLMDIRRHVCSGRRIYAEGGGLAYLCSQIEDSGGERTPMVGALPAIARRNQHPKPVEPAEVSLSRDCWLGPKGTELRGYLNSAWQLEATGSLLKYCEEDSPESSLVGRHRVVGSRMHLNFAALPGFLDRFLLPCPAALDMARLRTTPSEL